jgi:hypothetical protein
MSRWKASFIHLLISVLVLGGVAAYILYFWYPPALLHMTKADRLFLLIGCIDLVIGPLLTLIVYRTGKPSLKFDLCVIAILQVGFLVYGLHAAWISRPVFIVAVPDRFELVFANEISKKALEEARQTEFSRLGYAKPKLVGALTPQDHKEVENIIISAAAGRGDMQNMPKYFVTYETVVAGLMTHAKSISISKDLNQKNFDALEAAAMSYGRKPNEVKYLRLASSRGFATMLVDDKTGEVVGPVNIDL